MDDFEYLLPTDLDSYLQIVEKFELTGCFRCAHHGFGQVQCSQTTVSPVRTDDCIERTLLHGHTSYEINLLVRISSMRDKKPDLTVEMHPTKAL